MGEIDYGGLYVVVDVEVWNVLFVGELWGEYFVFKVMVIEIVWD